MRIQLETILIPALSFTAGVMATAIAVDMNARNDYAKQLHRIEEVKKAELLGTKEKLRV